MKYLTATKNKKYLMYISQNYSYAILRPLQAAVLANGGQVRWFLAGSEVNPDFLTTNEPRLHTIKDVKSWAPNITFIPGNVIPDFIPGKKVAVFHGFNSGKLNRKGKEDHFNIRGCYDLYCTQGPNTTTRFKELAKQHGFFKVAETGWPTLDPLFSNTANNPYVSDDSRPTLLICSTFSRNLSLAPKLYEQIKHFSETGKWRILMQFHPKMPAEWVNKYKALSNENLTFIETDNVLPLLQAADVMLCDTSSVLLMFLLLRKPVVTFCNQKPLPHLLDITDADEVETAIEHALTKPRDLMQNIESYCQEIHPYTDGQSSQRVLNAANEFLQSNDKLKPKPLNIIRQLKMRKDLNYWGW
ncbi:CDP-glycerol: N-acetyl-beta-D-mannosaminyl-1, 4-N-acetyl-D-glucosaminyldiphosphoundecaprenyl glycerophosphotransferase [Pseudoalteromonas sp. BSi20652]|uniref:CDP-glycerol glycerophosphotransferase family protein n=1 Tax=Pseudoalteromonas sp. BSi20652 TaxID=388384 RepID=UPI00023170CF|nr:CDP-glycerol glycerophosphotransferase family protein [Pseudoalteromonas sp. BSi20652]GAA61614.1 CDP-glycerol: N-acetyl-beta-D-mannosaminyl-1, 4-N-acetyl-D-glucosaminyldiphosphoundecaprenyl glycerophosphotransferase [Pseudoalteromonas sp. BSi20652]